MIIVDYFYTDANGEKVGPIKEQQLRKLAAQGVISPDTPLETTSGHKGTASMIPGMRFNTAVANPFTVIEQSALAKQAEQARLEAETSTIVAEVAAEKEAAATLRAANAIKAAAEKRAAEALKAADKMNAIADQAENNLRQFKAHRTTGGDHLLPNIVISILAMLLIGGIIGTVAWTMFSGNSTQRQDNLQEPANILRGNELKLDNPFDDPTVERKTERKTDNPFAN